MSTLTEPGTYTPDDLLSMPDGDRYELVDGNLVERNVSVLSSWVAARLLRIVGQYCDAHDLAWIFDADCGYQCFPGHPRKVRKPDVSLIRRERLPIEQIKEGFLTIPPDLVIEVVSPNDLAYEVEEKVQEYREVGVRLIWVVYPPTRTIYIHRLDGSVTAARPGDDLEGEDVVPGFRCRVDEIFPPLSPTAPAPTV